MSIDNIFDIKMYSRGLEKDFGFLFVTFLITAITAVNIIIIGFQLIMNRLVILLLFAVAIAMFAVPNEGMI